MKRRTLIKSIGLSSLLPLVPFSHIFANGAPRRPVLRVAHLTDIHIKDALDAPLHFKKCLESVREQKPAVDMILNGGDVVFDLNKEDLSSIKRQWDLYHSVLKDEGSVPVHYVLGNHDIWWNEDDKGQALYGKKYSMDRIGLARPYYSFIKNGWKFICLDSVHLDIDNTWYIGKLGDEQMDWLKYELAQTDQHMPISILSHIPILTATNLISDNIVNKWEMLGGEMHTDVAKIIQLFYQHKNVKLCLSGHIHLLEKLEYDNVTYICDGAVSGAWWKGNNKETAPGYGIIDYYSDGSFSHVYVNY